MTTGVRHPSSDAWLLLAIHGAFIAPEHRRGADRVSLTEVIAVGDALEHAIFSFDELTYGLARLIRHGHVIHDRRGFAIAPSFEPALRAAARHHPTARARVERLIGAAPWEARVSVDLGGERYPGVTEEQLDAAYRVYAAEMDPLVEAIIGSFRRAGLLDPARWR